MMRHFGAYPVRRRDPFSLRDDAFVIAAGPKALQRRLRDTAARSAGKAERIEYIPSLPA
jgi:hypothetical protein